jgi:hypothetical protein
MADALTPQADALQAPVYTPPAVEDAPLELTPQEQFMVNHHRANLEKGGVPNEGGTSTYYSIGENIGGKYYVLPSVWDNQIVDRDEAVRRAKEVGLDSFPSYNSEQEGEDRYQQIHHLMEKDLGNLPGTARWNPILDPNKELFTPQGLHRPEKTNWQQYQDWVQQQDEPEGFFGRGLGGMLDPLRLPSHLAGLPDALEQAQNTIMNSRDVPMDQWGPTGVGKQVAGAGLTIAGTLGADSPFRRANPNELGIWGGSRAANFDDVRFTDALMREIGGDKPEDIWRDQGFMRMPDDTWVHEISDQKARFVHGENWLQAYKNMGGGSVPLKDIFSHPELYKNYPDIADYKFRVDPTKGRGAAFNPNTKEIVVGDRIGFGKGNAENAMIHELNHAVAQIEHFHPGASVSDQKLIPGSHAWDILERMHKEKGLPPPDPKFSEVEALLGMVPIPKGITFKDYLRMRETAQFEAYHRRLGEVMSRNAEHRRKFSDDLRRGMYPGQTQMHMDYPVPQGQEFTD